MLRVFIVRVALVLAVLAGAASGQVTMPATSSLAFEVASIRRVGPFDPRTFFSGKNAHLGMLVDKARVDISHMSLMDLVCLAYRIRRGEVAGGPAWLFSRMDVERFDILAKMPDGATPEQVPEMLQALLAERFKLAVHHEKRTLPVYTLIVGKDGSKLKEAVPDAPAPANASESSTAPRTAGSRKSGQLRSKSGENGKIRFESDNMSMQRFSELLSQRLERPVLDETGLKGNYQVFYEIDLMARVMQLQEEVGREQEQLGSPAAAGNALFTPEDSLTSSLKQLGLKLESRKLPWDVLIVDHIESTPTEN